MSDLVLGQLGEWLYPTSAGLLLAGAFVAALWLRRRWFGMVCAASALVCAAFDFDWVATLAQHGSVRVADAAPEVLVVMLAAAGIVQQAPLSARARFSALAAVALLTVTVSLVLLADTAQLAPRSWIELIGCLALGLSCVDYLLRSRTVKARTAMRWLARPMTLAGIVGAAGAAWLIVAHEAFDPEHLGLALLAVTLPLGLAASLRAALRVRSRALTLHDRSTRRGRSLERRRHELRASSRAQRRTQLHYDELFQNVPAPVMLSDLSGNVLAANPACVKLFSAESEEHLKKHNVAEFYADPQTRARLLENWSLSDEDVHQGEIAMQRIDGEKVQVLYRLRLIRTDDGSIECIQGTMSDITALRKAEARRSALEGQARLSQRLEAVGRLAAGVAHEINTPMQYIGDNVYFLKETFQSLRQLLDWQKDMLAQARDPAECLAAVRDLQVSFEMEETLDDVPSAFDRAKEGIETVTAIVAGMKQLAHPGQGTKEGTDLNGVVNTALVVARNEYKTVATVVKELGVVPDVLGYKSDLCQALINLVVNAAHAIESVKRPSNALGVITIRTWREDDFVCVSVGDDGCGIPESVKEKIFDPFFTTKEVGKGTGQGLAMVRTTIVGRHGGDIGVTSAFGVGTTFTIRLPMRELPAAEESIFKETA